MGGRQYYQKSRYNDQRLRGAVFFHLAGLCRLGQTEGMEGLQLDVEIAERLWGHS